MCFRSLINMKDYLFRARKPTHCIPSALLVRSLGVFIKRSGRLKNIIGANRLYLFSYKNWSNKPNAWDMNTAASIKQKPTETHLYNGTWKKKYGEKKLVRGSVTQPRFLSRSSARSSTLTNSNPTPPTRKRKPMNNITNWSPSINSTLSAMPNAASEQRPK